MTPRKRSKAQAKRKKKRMLKRVLRASALMGALLAIGFYFEFHLLLKIAELIAGAAIEAIFFPD